jgi:hypothetical protein
MRPKESSSEIKVAQEEIKSLKSQLQKQKKTAPEVESKSIIQLLLILSHAYMIITEIVSPAATRPHKGASLANPNKKARKYQAIEFASDDDE